MTAGPERHPGEALSAWLDGELDRPAAADVAAHVEACPSCAAELDGVRAARAAVRGLPVVDPPLGLYRRVPAPRPRAARWGSSVAAASVAASLFLVGAGSPAVERLVPSLDGLAASHSGVQASTVGLGGGGGAVVAAPAAPAGDDEVAAPFRAPPVLAGGYRRVAVEHRGEAVHVLYDDGGGHLSLFEEVGRVDWDRLPEGDDVVVGGVVGRLFALPEGELFVWEDDDVVYAALGDSPQAVLAAATAVGPPRPLSLAQKLRRACRVAVDVLG